MIAGCVFQDPYYVYVRAAWRFAATRGESGELRDDVSRLAALLIALTAMTITAAGCSARQEAAGNGQASAVGSTAHADHARPVKKVDLPLDHERYMRAAIEQARNVPELPFGAVLVDSRSGEIVARGFNRSSAEPDLHGEIDVINRLAESRPEIDWPALVLYTTAEPCPMCQGAIQWAGIGNVVYGTSIETLAHSVGGRSTFARAK